MGDSWHEKVGNKHREDIISAGKQLFLQRNFLNVNIKDVCALAGTSRVTFYKYFSSIDDLIFEVQMDILSNMTQFIKTADKKEASGLERLKTMLYAWVDFAKQYNDHMKYIILFDLYYEAYDSNEELKIKYENFITKDTNENFISSAIIQGIQDKSLRGDLDPIKSGYYIFTTVMGLLQRMSYTTLPYSGKKLCFDEIATPVVEMIINSIRNSV
jgi:AcrR family transcriptional regulator